ncbi:cytochrome c biogenesis protein CcsA [Fulvivirgaceae bacterium BMA12]|uniref:Heme exporter protein C n=1 Tax=Agaribacillus aureus TaxID=3051825 RepID=A0ABT8LF70_9BACT|nr:cytochrome c biogenesis protein CcsA [Fulvivirgaceae bacterium BMA12]
MNFVKQSWWKILAVILVFYTIIGGFLFEAPRLAIVNETIRNLYFHVPMWFAMVTMLLISTIYSIKYLNKRNSLHDVVANEFANVGILLGILGLSTGSIWARFTWGAWWVNDPQLNAAAIGVLIYLAYAVLRNSIEDDQKRGTVSGVYNIFAFAAFVPLIFVLPRLADNSLHPGKGGNPGFNAYDLDSKLRMVFYPAVVGWALLGVWLASLGIRMKALYLKRED